MNKKQMILFIIVGLVALTILVLGNNTLQTLSVVEDEPVTNSPKTVWLGCPSSQRQITFFADDDIFTGGIFGDGTAYLTSWFPNELSESIQIENLVCGMTVPFKENEIFPFSRYGVDVGYYWWKVEIETGGQTIPIVDRNGIVEAEDGSLPARVDYGTAGKCTWTNGILLDGSYLNDLEDFDKMCNLTAPWWKFWEPGEQYLNVKTNPSQPLDLRLYGPYDGKIIVTLMNERFAWSDVCFSAGSNHCSKNVYVVREEATLLSSWGSLSVVPNPNPPGQNHFEEGQTVDISLSTDWAGTVQNGWVVKCYRPNAGSSSELPGNFYDNHGSLSYNSYYGGYRFGNDLNDWRLHWEIPIGTYNANGANRWRFQLFNTYTQVSGDYIDIIIEGGSQLVPGPTTLTFNKPVEDYNVGEQMTITATADANPAGTGVITHFELFVFTNENDPLGSQVAHLWNPASLLTGDTYKAIFQFTPTETSYLYFRGQAWDGDPEQGGMPGAYYEIDFGVTNPGDENKYAIKVQVLNNLNGKPIVGATVICGGQAPKKTNLQGTTVFTFLAPGDYDVLVTHEGYLSQSQKVTIVDENVEYTFRLNGAFQILPLLICALVIAIFVAIAWFLSISDVRIKVVIIAIGVIVSIVVYLFLSGILIFALG